MSTISSLLSQAEGTSKPKPEKWYLMFIVHGNEFDGDTYIAKKVDLNDIHRSIRQSVNEMQDRLRKEVDRVQDAWDNGIVDPGCNINFDGVFIANTDDDMDEYIPKMRGPGKIFHWLVYNCKKGLIKKNEEGFSEEISGALIKNATDVITKEIERRKLK